VSQLKHIPFPWTEPRHTLQTPLRVEINLVQVGTKQLKQEAVARAEVTPTIPPQDDPSGPGGGLRQRGYDGMFTSSRSKILSVERRVTYLGRCIEVPWADHTCDIASTGEVGARKELSVTAEVEVEFCVIIRSGTEREGMFTLVIFLKHRFEPGRQIPVVETHMITADEVSEPVQKGPRQSFSRSVASTFFEHPHQRTEIAFGEDLGHLPPPSSPVRVRRGPVHQKLYLNAHTPTKRRDAG
jgi:hypothetical protein